MILKLELPTVGNKSDRWDCIPYVRGWKTARIMLSDQELKQESEDCVLVVQSGDKSGKDLKDQQYGYVRIEVVVEEPNREVVVSNILTELSAWMMNDEGKTIERIN